MSNKILVLVIAFCLFAFTIKPTIKPTNKPFIKPTDKPRSKSLYKSSKQKPAQHIIGTWKLITGITITKGISTITDYTKKQNMIKIVNATHFAFLKHDLNVNKDSSNHFDAGGGTYSLIGDQYIEHLEYYNDKNWENKSFNFTITIKNDTLTQKGLEKVEKEGIDRIIIEKYVRLK